MSDRVGWAEPLNLGSDHAIFIEDNIFTSNAKESGGDDRFLRRSALGLTALLLPSSMAIRCHGTEARRDTGGREAGRSTKTLLSWLIRKVIKDCTSARATPV